MNRLTTTTVLLATAATAAAAAIVWAATAALDPDSPPTRPATAAPAPDYQALAAAARQQALTLPDPGPPEADPTVTHTAPRVGPDGPARWQEWLAAYLGTDGKQAAETMTPPVAMFCISPDDEVRAGWQAVQHRDVMRAGMTFLCPGRVWLLTDGPTR